MSWRDTIYDFAEHVSPSVGERWIAWPYLRFICNIIMAEMQACPQGARIVLNAPPRHGKSLLISQWLPTWFLEVFPRKRVAIGSYGADLARHWGKKVRNTFLGSRELWTKVTPGDGASDRWETTEGGGLLTAGVGGAWTGFGFHLGIIDDPCKDWADAHSPTMRKHERDWFDSVFYTRREPGAHIVVLMQRWHTEDLTGYLTRHHSDKWLHIRLPAMAEENDAMGRSVGEALCPERFNRDALVAIKRAQRNKWWGLYQQRPLPAEGSIIKPQWMRYYDSLPSDATPVCISVDANFKEGKENSFVSIGAWARRRADRFLMDQIREQMDFPPTMRALEGMIRRYPRCRAKLIEDKANGSAIISTLRKRISGVIPIKPNGGKDARLQACAPEFESGNVWVPAQSRWTADYVDELTNFPSVEFDDQVDMTSQALNWMAQRQASAGGGFGGMSIPH